MQKSRDAHFYFQESETNPSEKLPKHPKESHSLMSHNEESKWLQNADFEMENRDIVIRQTQLVK